MFTGIVEERGRVVSSVDGTLEIACAVVVDDSPVGASVAVNGVCLTVVTATGRSLAFDVSPETMARTTLDALADGAPVNLERPVNLLTRLGGHLVQGHVDGVGEVVGVVPDGPGGATLRVRVPGPLMPHVVEKGSIAVDGVSLTVAGIDGDDVSIALIPHTLAVTTLGEVRPGDRVNLEVDILAKYVARHVERLMQP